MAAPLGVNRLDHVVSDVWILNTDDLNFGVHDVQVTANIRTKQVGPLLANGSAEYLYLGCYFDGGGRLLAKQYNPANNENGVCQQTCYNAGYKFAGTEYRNYPIRRPIAALKDYRFAMLVWQYCAHGR